MARGSGKNQRGGGRPRRNQGRAARPQTNRHFPRTARLNALLHEIAADFMDRVDDDRLPLVTITGVEVDSDLNRAQVFVSTLDRTSAEVTAEDDEELLNILAAYAKPMRSAIGNQTRLRKTPEVIFQIDPAVRTGARIEEILSTLDLSDDVDDDAGDVGFDGDEEE